jgi:CBS domain-containing protein
VVPGDCSVMDAGAVMLNEEVRHLIVELGDGVGIVSLREVMAVLLCAVNPKIWLARLRVAVTGPSEIWLG